MDVDSFVVQVFFFSGLFGPMEFLGLGLVLRSVLWLGLVFWSEERVSNLVFVDKMMSISLAGENK